MKMSVRLLFLAMPGLIAGAAHATDGKGDYLILGPGSYTCQRIISDLARDAKEKNPASTIVYSNWLAGNLTAYNRDTKGNYSILGDETFADAFTWTLEFCEQHPSAIYAAAVDALVTKLRPHHYAAMPKKLEKEEREDDEDDGKNDGKGD